jgi:hypothetical protein
MKPKDYSTAQAAKIAGIDRVTLQRWIAGQRADCPQASIQIPLAGGLTLRRWTDADVVALKAYAKDHKLEGVGRPKKG